MKERKSKKERKVGKKRKGKERKGRGKERGSIMRHGTRVESRE